MGRAYKIRILAGALMTVWMTSLLCGCRQAGGGVGPDPASAESTTPTSVHTIHRTSVETVMTTDQGKQSMENHSTVFRPTSVVTQTTPTSSRLTNQSVSSDGSLTGDALYRYIWENELAYLASMQLENGAYPKTKIMNGNVSMNPYFADSVALALLDDGAKYKDSVKKYIQWHFSHLNTAQTDYNGLDGTIYDYTISLSKGKITKEEATQKNGHGHYDSTDSYAATFLCVLWKYYQVTQDKNLLQEHYPNINRIVNVMRATMVEGLSVSKPDYRIKYLMDNCEVYEGFLAAANLYEKALSAKVGSAEKAVQARDDASVVKANISAHMWNAQGKYYEPALNEMNKPCYTFSWDNWYPSATAQLFLIHRGLLSSSDPQAKMIYEDFNKAFSNGTADHMWEKIDIPGQFYWGAIPYTAALMGDKERVESYFTVYQRAMKQHAYPLYNADIAKVAMAAYRLLHS